MKVALLSHRGIFVRPGAATSALNVYLDGRHLWTVAPDTGVRRFGVLVRWPDELLRQMDGRSLFEVRDQNDSVLDSRFLTFGTSDQPIVLKDADGRTLTVNKWGRLTHGFEQQTREDKDRLIQRTAEVLGQLNDLGFDSFIVGGTLLGAMRGGDVLEHDDDADTAYLSKYSHPSDVALESFRLQRDFEALGYWIVRHSVSHFQVMFKTESGHIDHFVDVFAALFKDGRFYEPIHVDTDQVSMSDIVPTSTRELGGVELPTPANPERWLTACYGSEWRTPDPSFVFETPDDTVRRFHFWFGRLSLHRLYWDSRYQNVSILRGPSAAAERLAARLPPHSRVLEIACGTGADARYLASLGHEVVAFDFSWVAIERARQESGSKVDFRVANLYDRKEMLQLAIELRSEHRPIYVFMHHAIEGMTNSARVNAALLCKYLLRDESFAFMTFCASPGREFDMERPQTWHIPIHAVYKSAADHGLTARVDRTHVELVHGGKRLVADSTVSRRGRSNHGN
ncbi:class I SAM-dependent methyltransferase [Paramicrobacterium agarici]|uniref:Methyltransferase family protein n=1 Tax=Paramicrobacterium agarici TaxID=630514 RepID=A0A2A9E0I1_9MICO|nr:class I SAM-dependent methyltransferase [Microbacterium agarici]PFG31885.1 methyltransferase family protein [Microbacterium agarici]